MCYSVHGLKRPLFSPSEAWQDRGEAGLNDRDPRSPLRPVREPRSTRLVQSVLRNLWAFVLLSGFSLGSRSASCALRLQVHKLCTPRRPPSNANVNDRHWTGQLALAQNVRQSHMKRNTCQQNSYELVGIPKDYFACYFDFIRILLGSY